MCSYGEEHTEVSINVAFISLQQVCYRNENMKAIGEFVQVLWLFFLLCCCLILSGYIP